MDLGYDLKALAYPAPNPSVAEPVSPCLCSLVFLCDGGKLATLLLVVSMPTAHSTTDSSFVLQYDGDNLIPNNIKLRSSRGCLRREELQDVSSVAGDVKTLMLSTKQSCSVWCPATTPEFHPKQGSELALQRLVDLARATSVHIVFDFSQLHPPYKSTLKAFSKAARGLAGFPVEALLSKQGLRKASGEVFAPTEIAGAPPAYDAARTRKRPRKGEYPGALLSRRLTRARFQLALPAAQELHSHDADGQIVHDREDGISQSRDRGCRTATRASRLPHQRLHQCDRGGPSRCAY